MENSNTTPFDDLKFKTRMNEILNLDSSNFEQRNKIPTHNQLSYSNGFYVDVGAIFVDIVESSELTNIHKKPVLTKMYKTFIQELVVIFKSFETCKEININGDCVWGVFDITTKNDKQKLITYAEEINELINIINIHFRAKDYSELKVGIGIDIGNVLMTKAGYSGSGINDIVWIGKTINNACHLANKGNREFNKTLLITPQVYIELTSEQQSLFSYPFPSIEYYETDFSKPQNRSNTNKIFPY